MGKGSGKSSADEMKKEQTKTCPAEQSKLKLLVLGQAWIQVFFQAVQLGTKPVNMQDATYSDSTVRVMKQL